MKIEEISINDVIPYENNPRKNDGAVEAVANSIREFGFRVPIIIDRENVIIAGHTRLKAAEQLGLEKVPVVRADDLTEEQVRSYMKETLPKLNYWKKYKDIGGQERFDEFKNQIINEFNALNIAGMPKVTELNALIGSFVNLEYTMPNGQTVKLLDDNATYLGNQLECEFGSDRCFGIIANMDFLLVCTYEENGENPELVLYKKR